MAFRHLFLLLFLICFQNATALIPGKYDKLFSIGINVTKTEYNGDIGNSIFKFYEKSYWYYWGFGSTLSINLSPSFDLGINGNYGSYGYYVKPGDNFVSNKLDFSTLINYKLDNGYILNRENLFSPFLTTGIGFAQYSVNKKIDTQIPHRVDTNGRDLIVPIGAGVQFKFNKTWGFRYQYLYYITNNDKHDKRTESKNNDVFGQHILSIVYSFGNVERKEDCKCNF